MTVLAIRPRLALELIADCPLISYDTETSGLDRKARVVGFVVAGGGDSTYVPTRHTGGGNIPDADGFEVAVANAFKERERKGHRTVMHHAAFDLMMSSRHGIHIDGVLEDTMINEGLVNDIATLYGLDECAKRHNVTPKLGADLYAAIAAAFGGPPDRKQMEHFHRMPGDDDRVVDYSAGDGTTTLELWEKQQFWLDEYHLRRVWKLECNLIPHLAKIKRRGLKIDDAYAGRVLSDIQVQIDEAKLYFPKGFRVRSPKEMEAMFRAQGIDNFAKTPQGKPSFTEKWLETNEHGRAVLKIRQLEKAGSSFITPLIDTCNEKGRVHPTLNQSKNDDSGAVGGRLSCSDPNLQAFPKRNKVVGKVVRRLVVADEGFELSEADFKQQEPRLFGHFSEDENLVGGYLSEPPLDIHTVASRMTGLERDVAKRLGLGILTGMGIEALAGHMSWSMTQAKEGYDSFLTDAFPGIKQFQKDAKYTMRQRGYVTTLLGRRCTVDDPRFAYKAVSRIIQGSGADHMKTALLWLCQFSESLPDGVLQVLMTIHDSNIFQSELTERGRRAKMEAVKLLDSVATKLGCDIPIPTEVGTGLDWAEASYGK